MSWLISDGVERFPALGLKVCGEEFGIPLGRIAEVIPVPRITRVPHGPGYVRGVVNLHGNVTPVVDVARRLGLGETEVASEGRIVVLILGQESLGILAESVSKVAWFELRDLKPPPPLVAGIAAQYIEGVVRNKHRFYIFLDLERALADTSGGGDG